VPLVARARWNVTRHVPILPPYSALMVAHSAPQSGPEWGPAVLGATYDHRVLTGADVFNALRRLTTPEGVS
jgi:pyruvate dehydrogenase E2 component (dihydrolipoamide acetyltransferase)